MFINPDDIVAEVKIDRIGAYPVYFIHGCEIPMPQALAAEYGLTLLLDSSIIAISGMEDITLVDAGAYAYMKEKLKAMNRIGLPPGRIKRVVLTHGHVDHSGGIGELKRYGIRPEVWIHGAELIGDGDFVFGKPEYRSMFSRHVRIPQYTVSRKLTGGEELELAGMRWVVYHTPGHTPGGICLYAPSERILISGDTLFANGSVGRTDLPHSDHGQLISSLDRLARLEVAYLLPGHGFPIINNNPYGASENIMSAYAKALSIYQK